MIKSPPQPCTSKIFCYVRESGSLIRYEDTDGFSPIFCTFEKTDVNVYNISIMAKRIGIIGTGAIGITVGLHLLEEGWDVIFFAHHALRVRDIEREGLRLIVNHRKIHVYPPVYTLAQAPEGCVDAVILSVKAYSTSQVAEQAPRWMFEIPWLSLQNGLHHWTSLLERLDPERFSLASTSIAAFRVLPNTVRQTAAGETAVGSYLATNGNVYPPFWVEVLQRGGFPATVVEDIWPYLWRKLLFNAVVNPLTALARVPNRALIDVPDLRELAEHLLREAYPVVKSRLLPSWSLDRLLEDFYHLIQTTGENRSSMLQDILYGRPIESPWITGVLLDEAARQGIHLVRHETLQKLLEGFQVWQQVEGVHAR